ncbi:MAG TPA: NnrS family protein, partial [Burkholderiaceae bacterium]|nr:NnrS family protein [Burkholderiaceae bacterium]
MFVQLKPIPTATPPVHRLAEPAPLRWHHLLAAPHRLGFFGGLSMLALASLWWAAMLALRFAGAAVPWQVSPSTAHALLMAYGFMPFFFVGFLFTAGPRWLMLPPVPARTLLWPLGLMAFGWVAVGIGVHAAHGLAALGLALVALGFALLSGRFAALVKRSGVPDRDHARVVVVGCAATVFGLCAAALGVAFEHNALARAAAHFGLWGGAGLVFVSVAHRMIPFFTASALPGLDAWRPRVLLMIMVALVG